MAWRPSVAISAHNQVVVICGFLPKLTKIRLCEKSYKLVL